jgi:hypothetical protein
MRDSDESNENIVRKPAYYRQDTAIDFLKQRTSRRNPLEWWWYPWFTTPGSSLTENIPKKRLDIMEFTSWLSFKAVRCEEVAVLKSSTESRA